MPPEVYLGCGAACEALKKAGTIIAGQEVKSVTLGPDITIHFANPGQVPERLRKHEARHRYQAKQFLPWWARGWSPLRIFGNNVARVRFLEQYVRIFLMLTDEHGAAWAYRNHPMEIDARSAEES